MSDALRRAADDMLREIHTVWAAMLTEPDKDPTGNPIDPFDWIDWRDNIAKPTKDMFRAARDRFAHELASELNLPCPEDPEPLHALAEAIAAGRVVASTRSDRGWTVIPTTEEPAP